MNKIENISQSDSTLHISTTNMLENIKLAINPEFRDWILFKHGTYILFENAVVVPINKGDRPIQKF